MKRLDNKVAVVTGAASGLGLEICVLFASEGAKVVATDIEEDKLKELKERITGEGGTCHTVVADVTDKSQVQSMIESAVNEFGKLDILVNNAGVMDDFTIIGDIDDELWEKVMSINVNGAFNTIRFAIKKMLEAESGVIINIASIAGLFGFRAGVAYTTSKHAIVGMTKNVAFSYAKSGIRCNAIAPGEMATGMGDTDDIEISPLITEQLESGQKLSPRDSDPVEVARVALFLASDDASFVNGSVLVADGGWAAY